MLRTRSLLWSAAIGLLSSAAIAAPVAASDGDPAPDAPDCVQASAGWRYTFVTNGCDSPHHLTVRYADGTDVPCRSVSPGDSATFPGYGTQGNRVLGPDLCPSA